MAADPANLAIWKMIGLVKQNFEFTFKKTGFYIVWNLSSRSDHMLKSRQFPAHQSFGDHAANGFLEPNVTTISRRMNVRTAPYDVVVLEYDLEECSRHWSAKIIRSLGASTRNKI